MSRRDQNFGVGLHRQSNHLMTTHGSYHSPYSKPIDMTDYAPLAYTAGPAAEYANGSARSESLDNTGAGWTSQRARWVADVLAQLGQLAIDWIGQPPRARLRRTLDIDIDHAFAAHADHPGVDGADVDSREDRSTMVRLLVTVSIAPRNDAPPICPRGSPVGDLTSTDALLDALHRLAAANEAGPRGLRPITDIAPPGALPAMAMFQVRTYIDQHLADRIQLAELAALTRLSVGRFIRAFRCSTGLPPYRYLIQCRVAAAAALIRATDRPLAEIAQETGFSDQSHLCRSFAQVLRMTPSSYRRQFR